MSEPTKTAKIDPAAPKATPAVAAAAADVLAKCASCEAEQPVTHKCCAECGQPMAKASQAAYDKALAALGEFHKAHTDLPAKPEVKAGDHAEAERILKAQAGGEGAALVELLIGGQNRNTDHLVAVGEDARAIRIGIGEFVGLFVKALSAGFSAHEERVMAAVNALTTRVEDWEGTPGKARSASVAAFAKTVHTPAGGDEDESLRGEMLLKAAIDAVQAGKLEPADATLTQHYANRNHSLTSLATVDAPLADRLARALGASTH